LPLPQKHPAESRLAWLFSKLLKDNYWFISLCPRGRKCPRINKMFPDRQLVSCFIILTIAPDETLHAARWDRWFKPDESKIVMAAS
jgi:hypothetical protein